MIEGKTKKQLKKGEVLAETIETSEGAFQLWNVDIDADNDGIPFENPDDIDINGLAGNKLVRAMFPISKRTHGKFVEVIEGSCTTSRREGFDVNFDYEEEKHDPERDKYDITFDDAEKGGFIIFNAKVQQLRNILFYRRIDWIYVLHVY